MINKSALERQIIEANISYSSGIPFITDTEYDILWKQLYEIDPSNGLLYHTAQNKTDVTGLSWHKHQIFGTNKAFNMPDLKPFLTRFGSRQLIIEPKYDGCAAIITHVLKGITITLEGDGQRGRDVSHLMPYIKLPFELRNFQSVEIILSLNDWNPDFGKNPRNVVAGWLARKYDAPEAMMTAVPHDFGELNQKYYYSGDVEEMSEMLLKIHNEWSKIYPIDGLMIKVADEKLRLVVGNNGTTNTWSIAWKPPIQIKETTVVEIEWNVSRLGRVIPTVVYEPIELCGTTNSRVTANNADWLKTRNILVGSKIIVGKAGEIIPKILSVKNTSNESDKTAQKRQNGAATAQTGKTGVTIPIEQTDLSAANFNAVITHCPTCHEPLEWESVHLVCHGDNCIAKQIVSIAYFYSLKGIKIDGIGEQTIEKLLHNPKCYEILSNKPWALLDCLSYDILDEVIAVIGPVLTTSFLKQVALAHETKNMAHFISGLGLPSVAYKTALRLCQYLITGKLTMHVAEKAVQSFTQGTLIYHDAITEMRNFTFAPVPNVAKAIYCITGSLAQAREEMIEWMAAKEYEFSASVTRATDYLVVGDSPGKTKIAMAEKYNIPQITEAQLINRLKEK